MASKKTDSAEVKQLKARIAELEQKLSQYERAFDCTLAFTFEVKDFNDEGADAKAENVMDAVIEFLSNNSVDLEITNIDCCDRTVYDPTF